jgi:hypothetical protein
VKRFVFEYYEVWAMNLSFDQVNIDDRDNGAMTSGYTDNHDRLACSHKARQKNDASKSLEASAKDHSELGVYMGQLGRRANAMLRTHFQYLMYDIGMYDISYDKTIPFINQISIFGSIVVSISACHSQEQLAGGRGSIPRQRDTFFLRFRSSEPCFWSPTPLNQGTLHIKVLFSLFFLRSTLSLPTTPYPNLSRLP